MSITTDRGGEDFARLAEPFRRELVAYGYRMLGSVDDAEEVVQDVYLDAWRAYDRFRRPLVAAHLVVSHRHPGVREGHRAPQASPAAVGPACAGHRPHRAPPSR